jgi:enamine deaminase RidA (YjgF/YER057c/UK114 family)
MPGPVAGEGPVLRSHLHAQTIESHGCSIVLRRVDGPDAREIFFSCQPPAEVVDPGPQAEAVYRAIVSVLEEQGGSFGSVVRETVFLRNLRANVGLVREARHRVLAASEGTACMPATTEIEQPPLNERACLEVSIQAVLAHGSLPRFGPIKAMSGCDCAECAHAHGLRVHIGEDDRLYAGGLCGCGESAYEQTLAMFGVAENLLQQAGMDFSDVMRTWIYLREMERDYPDLNRARREFFAARGIDPVPASTGISGGPVPEAHDLCLDIYAVKAGRSLVRTVMTSPTLNEAGEYGADFVRGMRVEESNKAALLVSGTASIDEAGRTAHPGDFEAQADRMLANVAALLKGQGATFGDVVSAVTYLKNAADAKRLEEKLHEAGYTGFPNVLVEAPICRSDLLCETEALAVLPRSGSRPAHDPGGKG